MQNQTERNEVGCQKFAGRRRFIAEMNVRNQDLQRKNESGSQGGRGDRSCVLHPSGDESWALVSPFQCRHSFACLVGSAIKPVTDHPDERHFSVPGIDPKLVPGDDMGRSQAGDQPMRSMP